MIALVLSVVLQHWLVVNDIHLNPFSPYGVEYGTDTTKTLWRSALRAMRADVPDARVVLVGGDLLAHEFPQRAHAAGQQAESPALAAMREIAAGLDGDFPKAQFLFALGNNDDFCGDYRSDVSGPYMQSLTRIWAPLVDRAGVAPDFSTRFPSGGYYTARLPIRNGRAIVLNSIFWSIVYRGGCSSRPIDPGTTEMTWLGGALERLPPGTNAMLLMHIPPGYDPQSTSTVHRLLAVPFLMRRFDDAFVNLVAEHRAVVRFIIGAHTHHYDFRVVAGVPMLIASSISPIYRNNPAFYVVDVDDDGNVHDVHPYVYHPGADAWEREPSFDTMYGVRRLRATTLTAIAARVRSDPRVREVWAHAYGAWSRREPSIERNWLPYACAQTEMEGGYAACAGTSSRGRTVALIVAALAIAAFTLVWLALRRRATRTRS